ncbi:MAG: hypothetical protein ABJG41_17000 [Cyclobacteriaceae bacterium]
MKVVAMASLNICLAFFLTYQGLASNITDSHKKDKVLAKLENEQLRLTFFKSKMEASSVYITYEAKTARGWTTIETNPAAEKYQIIVADTTLKMDLYRLMHPKWKKYKGGDVPYGSDITKVVWEAGERITGQVKSVKQLGKNKVSLRFHELGIGNLSAIWTLESESNAVSVALRFKPKKTAHYSLGYFLSQSKPIEEVEEVLMPMLVQQKRFPKETYTQLQAAAPTPLSIMEFLGENGRWTMGLTGDPDEVPFEFPVPIKSRYGLQIRNDNGEVQPSIFGPLPGTEYALAEEGEELTFRFKIFLDDVDWYMAYRDISDNIFGLKDYRKNGQVSMTQSVYNMIDLYKDDKFGGWWNRAKANYQIESKNGSTQSSPLTAISLYRLTGDTSLYQNRTLPTLEYVLSRDNPHFSPRPEDTGGYNRGHMDGPLDIFGTSVYGGIWEMSNRRTQVFKNIAFPDKGINLSTTQQNFIPHIQPFDEWLGRYQITHDKVALDSAIQMADRYIERVVDVPQDEWISLREFFLMAYTPNWEGLLRMYEITGDEKYLQASAKAARLTMTGMWTQPMPENKDITIHKNNVVHGDKMDRWLHRGEEEFRLGFPVSENDFQEKQVPEWLVSNVGLGFEQPSTYTYKDNGGRMILQANWTAAFLRLALYTGDKTYETYARNAAIGRVGNYAGYYYTTFTDALQNPRYPYQGPDISFIYYHHLPVHLSWTIDYLVSEAMLASGGKVRFPGLRQFGYAYFDNLVYGHAPGQVFGEENVWLWFDKDLVQVDNTQINYITAHSKDAFYLILMNESTATQQVSLSFNAKSIDANKPVLEKAQSMVSGRDIPLSSNSCDLSIGARGYEVLKVTDLNIHVPTHQVVYPEGTGVEEPLVEISCEDETKVRAMAIQVNPEEWNAFVYATSESKTLDKIVLKWETDEAEGEMIDLDYPYEFSLPLRSEQKWVWFSVDQYRKDGEVIKTQKRKLKNIEQ